MATFNQEGQTVYGQQVNAVNVTINGDKIIADGVLVTGETDEIDGTGARTTRTTGNGDSLISESSEARRSYLHSRQLRRSFFRTYS